MLIAWYETPLIYDECGKCRGVSIVCLFSTVCKRIHCSPQSRRTLCTSSMLNSGLSQMVTADSEHTLASSSCLCWRQVSNNNLLSYFVTEADPMSKAGHHHCDVSIPAITLSTYQLTAKRSSFPVQGDMQTAVCRETRLVISDGRYYVSWRQISKKGEITSDLHKH